MNVEITPEVWTRNYNSLVWTSTILGVVLPMNIAIRYCTGWPWEQSSRCTICCYQRLHYESNNYDLLVYVLHFIENPYFGRLYSDLASSSDISDAALTCFYKPAIRASWCEFNFSNELTFLNALVLFLLYLHVE